MNTQVPADLSAVESYDDLVALRDALITEFDESFDEGATATELNEIADAIESVKNEIAARDEQREADDAERAATRARVHGESTDDDDEDTEPVAEGEGENTDDDDDTEPVAEGGEGEGATSEGEREPVTAGGNKPPTRKAPSAAAIRSRSPRPSNDGAGDSTPRVSITAAADVPNVSNGAELDVSGVAVAMHARARGLSNGSPRMPVAAVHLPTPAEYMIHETSDAQAIIAAATAVKDAQSLVAAGGWCAPSETLYDQFAIESRDNLFQLPTVGINRSGINVPSFFDISDAAGALWTWTEANDIDAAPDGIPSKPCLRIPCPTWTEYTLEAEGLCLTHGNLQNSAYPELTTRFVNLTMTAHLHRVANAKLAKVVADAAAVTLPAIPTDAAGELLNAIELQVADFRSQYLMGNGTTLETVFPTWALGVIRSTIAMRNGVEAFNVSDAEIIGWFTSRNVRPQFVAGYQGLYAAAPATAWPATLKFLIYPAGSYFDGTGPVIDLGVVRDSTLNATNDYTAAWTEQFYLVGRKGPAAREVTVNVPVNGLTGGEAIKVAQQV